MAKTCPSCGYRPIGPFTDNCPICAEPVRNVRSDAGGFGGGSAGWSPVLKGFGIAALVVLVVAGGCCGIGVWQIGNAMRDAEQMMREAQAKAEAERKARTVAVSAAELLREFDADPAAADRKYQGKYLALTGVVERVGKGADGRWFVILNGGNEAAKLKVECFFDLADRQEVGLIDGLTAGAPVTLSGEYSGRVSHIQVRECTLVR